MGGQWLREALMVLNRVWLAAVGVAALAWSGVAAAQAYRPDEFLSLDLSKAVLSPRPLGPATSFTPGPLDVTVDRGNKPAQANAELVVDPKTVPAETVRADSKPMANEIKPAANPALAQRTVAPHVRVAHARAEPPAPHKPHALVGLHGRNPVEAQAQDTGNRTRIQVWPCKSGGICNWKR
jgi:hypothetical protein